MRKLFPLVAIFLVPFLVAAAEKLNVKTGLWEITSLTEMQGMPPVPKEVLEKMSPEQRGMDDYLCKPAGPNEFRAALDRWTKTP